MLEMLLKLENAIDQRKYTMYFAPKKQSIQVAQLSERDRAAGWLSYGQKWKTGTGRQYFTDIISLGYLQPL